MIKLFNRRKDYIVRIISKNKVQEVEVKAVNKKEAAIMVNDVIANCDIFGYDLKNNVSLQCKRIRKSKGLVKKTGSFFMKGGKEYE